MEYQPKFNLTKEENIFLAKRNIVDYIWRSANLEGIGVTYPDTQAIYSGMAVSGYTVDDINAVTGLKHGWHKVLSTIDQPLDLDYIKDVHRELGRFTIINAGCLRLDPAGIGGTEWKPELPDEERLASELNEKLDIENLLERALEVTLFLMRAQAFYDGNKRIAMLIGNKLMIQYGLGILSVPREQINTFYEKLIRFYESGDYGPMKEFLYETCIDGMNITRRTD